MNILTLSKPRLSVSEYLVLCGMHFRRYWLQYSFPVMMMFILQIFIRIDVNYTDSLPDHLFITVKGWKSGLTRGDYVAYTFPTDNAVSIFRKGDHMVKIVGGVGGDRVERQESGAFVVIPAGTSPARQALGGINYGVAKSYSRTGQRLEPGPVGVIPVGSYYVFAPHKDSLDSRYAIVGWITDEHIIGRIFPIF